MSPTRPQSPPDPFKASKEKSGDALTTSLKAAIAIILSFSVSFALYTLVHVTSARPAFFRSPDPIHRQQRLGSSAADEPATNISHIAFGIGGSARTWQSRGRYSDLWWKPGATRGFVFLDEEPGRETGRFKIQHRVSSDWRRFRHTAGSDSAVRIARIVADLFRTELPEVRWLVMGDDDTIFFPENVAAALARYDHRKMVYVGGSSESVEQDVMHAYGMAFGGGGFAVSYPLAAGLVSEIDGCLDRYHYFYGSDQRVWACVAEFGVGLSREPGFHQTDIRGDPFGLLSAHPVAPLASLHHLDNVNPLFPGKTQLESLTRLFQAYEFDPSRTLQQCFCYHADRRWSVSVAWGYAVQIYPLFLTPADLTTPVLTFQTWRTRSNGPFTFNTRRLDPDPCRRPFVFYMDSVKDSDSGETLTRYLKLAENPNPPQNCDQSYALAMAIEDILVFAPKMDPGDWKQRPRRHCCEIIPTGNNTTQTAGTLRIRVRKCKPAERISI
ncbi:uncharacterized protein LOC127244968 isoform X2 [Andrographis paniculata]|uniref:uncharacterized protein LOC127244968 isoform X2 n=1 Tax=Andrographis paniculata TaxID=175694 RepID=UPI0021E9A9C8|nr:uncharacterized protein LOC127244968 isoform X2 [Andrographis paniculata]